MKLKLININNAPMYIDEIKQLYIKSFPEEERREWNDIVCMIEKKNIFFNMYVIIFDGDYVGFITWWNFMSFRYVEHFAIKEELRDKNIGSRSICKFCKMQSSPVVLEVELPTLGEFAYRRIKFYERNGFIAHHEYKYLQPPYAANLPEIPLLLMSWSAKNKIECIDEIAEQIHLYVYKKG